MMHDMMGGGMMWGRGLLALLVVVALVPLNPSRMICGRFVRRFSCATSAPLRRGGHASATARTAGQQNRAEGRRGHRLPTRSTTSRPTRIGRGGISRGCDHDAGPGIGRFECGSSQLAWCSSLPSRRPILRRRTGYSRSAAGRSAPRSATSARSCRATSHTSSCPASLSRPTTTPRPDRPRARGRTIWRATVAQQSERTFTACPSTPGAARSACPRLSVSLLPFVDTREQAGDVGNRRHFGCHSIRAGHPSSSTIFRTGRLLAPSMPVSSSTLPGLPPQPS
jgi:hypothetical protein